MARQGEEDRVRRGQEDSFSHPFIPPLQPEEACASVTPRDGNTKYDKMSTETHKKKKKRKE